MSEPKKSKPKKQKDHQAAPPAKGTMECPRQHRWSVVDLNPERITVHCPVCGGLTSIKEGLTYDGPQG